MTPLTVSGLSYLKTRTWLLPEVLHTLHAVSKGLVRILLGLGRDPHPHHPQWVSEASLGAISLPVP